MKNIYKYLIPIFILITSTVYGKSLQTRQPFQWHINVNDELGTIAVQIKSKHYLYADKTKIVISDSAGETLSIYREPAPVKYNDSTAGQSLIYSGGNRYEWFFLPKGKPPYKIRVRYQGCRKGNASSVSLCFPPMTQVFETDSVVMTKSESAPQIEDEQQQRENSPLLELSQKKDTVISSMLQKGGIWIFVTAFLAGLLSTFTPCVLPMIPITLSILAPGKGMGTWQAVHRSMIYILGLVVTFTLAATIAALAGKCLGADILGSRMVIVIFTIFLILMAFSMLGLYEFQLPPRIMNLLNRKRKNTWIGAFVMGCAGGFVAFPCTGPVLTVLMGIVTMSANPAYGAALLGLYAVGFGLPFLVMGAGFGRLKPGAGMNQVKSLIGISLLAIAVYCMGMISDSFSQFISYGELKQKALSLILIMAGVMLGAVHLDAYTLNHTKKWVKTIGSIILSIGLVWNLSMTGSKEYSIDWMDDLREAIKMAQAENKRVLIDFTADWCAACKKMDATTFKDGTVIKELERNWIPVKIDSTVQSTKIESILKKFNITGLPSMVILDSDGRMVKKLAGFQEASDLKTELEQFSYNGQGAVNNRNNQYVTN